ncbi:aromatic prenyltransferase [Lentzea sp. BCCO 10_0061]|uniref:Aromatic prenyltransferase n=1 Tax=Lentzea sokolovensis TaxID=3095429 RepID=A0ABU4VCI4_9PSEU|nr:aromatic prenyltransferase [Lentzea sp. BCCO 10_0061]MDX8149484.1 aromatic prenyltransferase [Lentzea sp. BCCO 10_0061]
MSASRTEFDVSRFLSEGAQLARELDAPWDAEVVRAAVTSFSDHFHTGAVLWKTTSRPGDSLYYRFFARGRDDVTEAALRAGLVPEGTLTSLTSAWYEDFGPDTIQCGDFDGTHGLAKIWTYLGAPRPTIEVLDRPGVPETLRASLAAFVRFGLTHIRFVAADHVRNSFNVYFRVRGPLTPERATEVLSLLGMAGPDRSTAEDIKAVVPHDFCVAVTFSATSGHAERACFYALNVPVEKMPALPERIDDFFGKAPCHDVDGFRAIGWSYGAGRGTYIKAERAYCGDVSGRLRDWDCYFSGDRTRDPALAGGVPTVQVVDAVSTYEGKQKMSTVAGVCKESVDARNICMHLIAMPPRTRGHVHLHEEHETSLYVSKGWSRTYFGHSLEHFVDAKAGQLIYIPAGIPHLATNLSDEPVEGVVARTDPNEQESVVLVAELEQIAARRFDEDLPVDRREPLVASA